MSPPRPPSSHLGTQPAHLGSPSSYPGLCVICSQHGSQGGAVETRSWTMSPAGILAMESFCIRVTAKVVVMTPKALEQSLSTSISDMWGWMIFCAGGRPASCRGFSSISGLHPLDASSVPPPGVTTRAPHAHAPKVVWVTPVHYVPSFSLCASCQQG